MNTSTPQTILKNIYPSGPKVSLENDESTLLAIGTMSLFIITNLLLLVITIPMVITSHLKHLLGMTSIFVFSFVIK